MGLIEEIQDIQKESHEKWFERWYKEQDLENRLKISASQGYTSRYIAVSDVDNSYLKRRLSNHNTIKLLKDKLGEGFEVRLEKDVRESILGLKIHRSYITITW